MLYFDIGSSVFARIVSVDEMTMVQDNMAPNRNMDSRWVRRYRSFFIVGSVILGIQVFLAYRFFPIDVEEDESSQEHRDLSGKGLNIEVSRPTVVYVQTRAIVTRGAVLLKDLMLLNQQGFIKNKGKVPVHGREDT